MTPNNIEGTVSNVTPPNIESSFHDDAPSWNELNPNREVEPMVLGEEWKLTYYGVSDSEKEETRRELLCSLLNGTHIATVRPDRQRPQATTTREIFEFTPAQKNLAPEVAGEVSQVPTNINLPRYLNFALNINGRHAEIDKDTLVRTLDLRNRSLDLECNMVVPETGANANLKITMFLHYGQPDLSVMNVQIQPSANDQLTLFSGIDNKISEDEAHFFSPDPPIVETSSQSHSLTYAHKTASDQDFAITQRMDLFDANHQPIDIAPSPVDPDSGPFSHSQKIGLSAKAGQTYNLVSVTSKQVTEPDRDLRLGPPAHPPLQASQLAVAERQTFTDLLSQHDAIWAKQWEQISVPLFAGDPEAQAAVLHCISTIIADAGSDEHGYLFASQAAKIANAPGEGYHGRGFWDHDIFVPQILSWAQRRAQLQRRFYQLPAAQHKARMLGFKGAFWGWESSKVSMSESGPQIVTNAVGKLTEVEVLTSGIHLSADIVNELIEYFRLTGDREFLDKKGVEMVTEATRFLVSRATFDETSQTYGFYNVTGPDEYHENINRDAYTQVMAGQTLRFAVELVDAGLIKIDADEARQWREFRQKLYLPFNPTTLEFTPIDGWDQLIHIDIASPDSPYYGITELDAYLQEQALEQAIDLHLQKHPWRERGSVTKEEYVALITPMVRARLSEAEHHPIRQTDVLKQPNVNLMLVLLDEQVIDLIEDQQGETAVSDMMRLHNCHTKSQLMEAIYKANAKLNRQTCYGSSLSPIIQVMSELAAGRSPDECYEIFLKALFMDLGTQDTHNTSRGLHTANMASAVWAVIRGFMGIKAVSGSLNIDPRLPSAWDNASCPIQYYGNTLMVTIDRLANRITVELTKTDQSIQTVTIQGIKAELSPDNPVLVVENGRLKNERLNR